MATTGNDPRTNFPREFGICPSCDRKGLMHVKGTLARRPDGTLTGFPPARRCKYCKRRFPDCTQEEYDAILNRGAATDLTHAEERSMTNDTPLDPTLGTGRS